MGKDIRDMEGIEVMAAFAAAWVKYLILMIFVVCSSVAHIAKKFKRSDKDV